MKFGSGALLVAVGLLVLWLAVSGRLTNLGAAWNTLNGTPTTGDSSGVSPVSMLAPQSFPIEALPPLPSVVPSLG